MQTPLGVSGRFHAPDTALSVPRLPVRRHRLRVATDLLA